MFYASSRIFLIIRRASFFLSSLAKRFQQGTDLVATTSTIKKSNVPTIKYICIYTHTYIYMNVRIYRVDN